ncbi:MAG TPA: amino acid ABC transporter permease [Anaerolineae bacterium]|nr:amino acid ABC transporter permease [Anaerolineae bacterium]
MTAKTESFTQRLNESVTKRFNWQYFLQDNITGAWWLTLWVIVLALATAVYTGRQLSENPVSTIVVLIGWVVAMILVAIDGLHIWHSNVGSWLRRNLLSSVSNALISLLLLLIVIAGIISAWEWAVVNATFDPALTEPQYRTPDGATWGVIIGARDLLMVGRFPRESIGRVWIAALFFITLGGISLITKKIGLWDRNKIVRGILSVFWFISPFIVYILLAGVSAEGPFLNLQILLLGELVILATFALLVWQKVIKFSWLSLIGWAVIWPLAYVIWRAIGKSELFPPINVNLWGGLMLTLIIATAVILLSFPIGMVLALGRRSEVRGIPWWIIWPVTIIITLWGLSTSTTQILASARNTFEQIIAFWPLLLIVVAYILQRTFKGNVIAFASTAFIEFIRGVPLITLLFMAIIMAPFFMPEGLTLENIWAVILGYALFSAAYMAELIRGGLQALPRGQYDAADAIGLNTLQKMRFIILPQALRIVIPGIVGQFIGSFKSSSLVSIVGLFELLGIVRVIVANPQWLGLRKELYVFVGIIYFSGSFIMSWYSRRLEARLGVGQR